MNVQPNREGFIETVNDQAMPEPQIDAAPPPDPVEAWPVRVKLLHKPVRNNKNELVHELVFREPTGGDINRYGNPCRIDVNGEVVIDEQKMMRILAALSGILLPNLEPMDPRDWNSCAYRLRSFFLPEVAAW
jgi:Phage tail assembly chaperone proteins, E, or 41 or 14